MTISTPLVTHTFVGLAVAAGIAIAGSSAVAPAPSGQPDAAEMDTQAMLQDWVKLNQPGEKHKWFERFVGEWETTTRMTIPGSPPMESKGHARYTLMLDGRFLALESEGEFMGMSVKGYGLTGYDNFRNMYNMFWIDSTSTRWYTSRGRVTQDGSTLETYGSMDEPSMNEIGKPVRYVIRIIDDDTHVFEVWEVGGVEFKVFEITYKRSQ